MHPSKVELEKCKVNLKNAVHKVVSRIFKNAKQSCSFPIAGNVQATCGRRSWGGIITFNKNSSFHNNPTCLTSPGEVPALQFQLAASKIWRGSWTELLAWPHPGKDKYKYNTHANTNTSKYEETNILHIQSSTNTKINSNTNMCKCQNMTAQHSGEQLQLVQSHPVGTFP